MIEPLELLTVLRTGRYRYINEAEMSCLAYFVLGYPAEDIAEAVSESTSTVRRHLARVREAAAAHVGIELSSDIFRTWVLCHLGDCTAPVQELIGDAQVLELLARPSLDGIGRIAN